jgi:hypothetical protein
MTGLHCTALARALFFSTLAIGSLGMNAAALAQDTPAPASSPGPDMSPDAPKGRHHNNPAWQACKKQADDQKLAPGDARREFMKNCVKSAKDAAPPAS